MLKVALLPTPGRRFAPLGGPSPACWDPAGKRLAVVVGESIGVLHLGDSALRVLDRPREEARAIAWSPDGAALVITAEDRDEQRLVRVPDGAELWRTSIGEALVDEVVWSPDGRRIAYVGDELIVCDAGTGAVLWRRREPRVRTLAGVSVTGDVGRPRFAEHVHFEEELLAPGEAHWSPDSGLLAVRWESLFRVLDARDGAVRAEGPVAGGVLRWNAGGVPLFTDGARRLAAFTSRIGDRWARTLTFSRDGRFVAAEGDNHRLWVQDEHGVRSLNGHPRTITAMAWSKDGVLATACRDRVVRRWSFANELEAWANLAVQDGGLFWSPDGAHLAVCCADSIVILSA